jgi:hypothetical protein
MAANLCGGTQSGNQYNFNNHEMQNHSLKCIFEKAI